MSNLQNASGNLKEILNAIADGKDIQYWSEPDDEWMTIRVSYSFALDEDGLKLKWRVKPDAFVCWWQSLETRSNDPKAMALAAWNTAMEHKE